jgi:hypothetical protein
MQQATGLGDPFSENFLQLFCKKYFEKGILCQKFPVVSFFKIIKKDIQFFLPKIATTAYNMKGCFIFFCFNILNIVRFG